MEGNWGGAQFEVFPVSLAVSHQNTLRVSR